MTQPATKHDDPPTTEQVLQDMLTENTGRHFLDSGGAYGRNWERNQGRAFDNEPEATVDFRWGYLDVTVNLYHFLKDRLEYNAELDAEFRAFANSDEMEDESWFSCADAWITKLGEDEDREVAGLYGDGDPMTVNTYNGEDLLSQVIQYTYWEDRDGAHVLLQIHGGCDVRGGYTAPRVFDIDDYNETALFDNARASIYCTGDRQDRRQLNLETGQPDPYCDFVMDLDGGYVTDRNGNEVAVHLIDRDKDPEDQDDPPNAPRWGSVVRIEFDEDHGYCPHCGSTLAAGPHPC